MEIVVFNSVVMMGILFFFTIAEVCLINISNADILKIQKAYPFVANIWNNLKKNYCKTMILIEIMRITPLLTGAMIVGVTLAGHGWLKWIAPAITVLCYVTVQWGVILAQTLTLRFKIPFAILTAIHCISLNCCFIRYFGCLRK